MEIKGNYKNKYLLYTGRAFVVVSIARVTNAVEGLINSAVDAFVGFVVVENFENFSVTQQPLIFILLVFG